MQDSSFIQFFRDCAPYIHAHRGKTCVILISGEALESELIDHLVSDIALLPSLGMKVVLVVGARPQIDAMLATKGVTCQFNQGLRITDHATLDVIVKVNGQLRVNLESRFSLGTINSPMHNSQVQLISGNLVSAQPIGVIDGIDYGYTGRVRSIKTELIRNLLNQNQVVLMPHLGYSLSGDVFNLSSEEVAVKTAHALGADKLVLIGRTDLFEQTPAQLGPAQTLGLLDQHKDGDQGYRELRAAFDACQAGVPRSHIIDHRQSGALLSELYTRDGNGVMVSKDHYDDMRQAKLLDIPGILDLIEPLEQQGVLVPRSKEFIEHEIDDFYVFERDGMVTGCAALHPYPEESIGELACVAIHTEYRGTGRGDQLLKTIETIAKRQGLTKLFVLTTQTAQWFIERGYKEAHKDAMPLAKQQSYNSKRNSRIYIKDL